MTSSRPYLIRAIHEWIVDNGFTPQIIASVEVDGVRVPSDYVKDGQIVLNISADAVRDLLLGNESIEFNARFGGTPFQVVVPTCAVLAVAARENGAGMSFPEENHQDDPPPKAESPSKSRPSLRIVK